jgi:hypothetical protein
MGARGETMRDNDKCITVRWYVSDVLELRPDLSEMEAWGVLLSIFDSDLLREHGVSNDVIKDTAHRLFPKT